MANTDNDERNLPPTARRLEDARRAGDVALSQDLVAAISLVAGWGALALGGAAMVGGVVAYLHVALARATAGATVAQALRDGLFVLVTSLVLPLVAVSAAAVIAGLMQARGRLAPIFRHVGEPRVGLSLRRLLGRERVAEVVFDGFKIGALVAFAAGSLRTVVRTCAVLPQVEPATSGRVLAGLVLRLGTQLVGAIVVLAAVDYGWRVLKYRHRLRMSHQGARRDERESEGNPELKAERRRLQRALLDASAPPADMGRVDLLVLEPGVVGVAVAWRGTTGAAPVVLARAAGPHLPRLERAARQAGVAISIDPPLARALAFTEEGSEIAERQYGALARAAATARCVLPRLGPGAGGGVRI